MSVKWVDRALDLPPEIGGPQRMVLVVLGDSANAEGVCWPGVGEIARRSGVSERSVQRHLADLAAGIPECLTAYTDRPLVTVETRSAAGRQKSNRYILCIPPRPDGGWGDNLSPLDEAPDDGNTHPRGDRLSPLDESRGVTDCRGGVTELCHRGGDTAVSPLVEPSVEPSLKTNPPNPPATRVGSGGVAAQTTTTTTTTTATATAGQGQDARATGETATRATAIGGMPDGAGMAPGGGEHPDGPIAEHLERLVADVTGNVADRRWQRAVRRYRKTTLRCDEALGRIHVEAVRLAWARRDRKRFSLDTVLEAVAALTAQRREAERRAADAGKRQAAVEDEHVRREVEQRDRLAWFRGYVDAEARQYYLCSAETRLRDLRRGADPPHHVVESLAASDAARELNWRGEAAREPVAACANGGGQ